MGEDRSTAGFAGIVLTGGASRRMGRDKALLVVDHLPLAVRVAEVLVAAGAETVLAVGGDTEALAAEGLETIEDRWPGEGPLGGMVTGLDHLAAIDHRAPTAVVAACDLPRLNPAVVRALVDRLVGTDPNQVWAAVPVVDGAVQYHLVALRRLARSRLAEAFAAGVRAPRQVLTDRTVLVPIGAADGEALADVDTPDDIAALDRLRRADRPRGAGGRG